MWLLFATIGMRRSGAVDAARTSWSWSGVQSVADWQLGQVDRILLHQNRPEPEVMAPWSPAP
jgi:hypothetical protein